MYIRNIGSASFIPKLLLNCDRLYFRISVYELQLSTYDKKIYSIYLL
jgi:hypothetical protein